METTIDNIKIEKDGLVVRNINAEMIAPHVDSDTTDAERE